MRPKSLVGSVVLCLCLAFVPSIPSNLINIAVCLCTFQTKPISLISGNLAAVLYKLLSLYVKTYNVAKRAKRGVREQSPAVKQLYIKQVGMILAIDWIAHPADPQSHLESSLYGTGRDV